MISRSSVVGAFPTKPLEDVVEFLDSMRRPVTESERRAGPYPYYGANGQQGTIDDFIFDEPLLLLAEDGGHFDDPSRGIAYRVSGKTWVNNHAHVLRPNGEMDLGFLCRVLENYDVTPWVTGTTRGKLTQAGAAQIIVPVPPLPEQRRIAAILDKADALRAKRRAALAQLDTLTQSIFLDMFGDPATNPKGWPRESLGNITLKITDGEHLNPSFSQTGMPIVMAGDVLEDRIDFGSSKFVERDLGIRFRRKCDPERDDLLIVSRGATIGRLCAVRTAQEFCLMGSVILVKPVRDKIDPIFLSTFLKHPVSRHALYKTSGSSAQQAIYLKDVKKLACILPPISLQREFSCHVVSIEQVKAILRASLVELNALFGALQHRAFRGDLKRVLGEIPEEPRGIRL